MKKCYLSLLLLAVIGVSANAQKGAAIGLNVGYGSEMSSFAIGAKFNYGLTDNLRLSPSFNYFLGDDFLSGWEINADVHYLFHASDNFAIYPLAGVAYASYGGLTSEFGANVGAGAGFALTDALVLGLEVKYSVLTIGQVVPSINLTYKF